MGVTAQRGRLGSGAGVLPEQVDLPQVEEYLASRGLVGDVLDARHQAE